MSSHAKLPPWGNAIAGATGAVLANALVYPLDIVKTRLQVQVKPKASYTTDLAAKSQFDEESDCEINGHAGSTCSRHHYNSTWDAVTKIVDEEGVQGLYAGMAGSLVGVASTNFAYFYWYTIVRSLYLKISEQGATSSPSTPVELSLGAVSGALAQLFTIPVSVVTTRQQTQPRNGRKSFVDTAKEVVHGEDGVSGLWRGLKASLVLVVNPSITYGAYQRLREVLFPGQATLRPREAFLLGSLSKMMATIATQPLIVAKVGLQSRPPPGRKGKPFGSFVEVMRYIIEHEGAASLFKGIGPQIVKGILVQGLLMMTKERMELMFIMLFRYLQKIKTQRLKRSPILT